MCVNGKVLSEGLSEEPKENKFEEKDRTIRMTFF